MARPSDTAGTEPAGITPSLNTEELNRRDSIVFSNHGELDYISLNEFRRRMIADPEALFEDIRSRYWDYEETIEDQKVQIAEATVKKQEVAADLILSQQEVQCLQKELNQAIAE
ncbi:hypothetical protein MAP00_007035 [Monascus purpureus]|nr:hypothetical protein MAP00_007035 [Monascus purpureus]